MSALAATLRIARRDARRAKGRSLLVVAMIALPVLGVTAADVVARTFELSPEQLAARDLGAADASLLDTGQRSVEQLPGRYAGYSGETTPRTGPAVPPATVLPAGSRLVVDRQTDGTVAVPGRTARVSVRTLDVADPLTAGLYELASGRAASAVGEVALTTALADRLDVAVGGEVAVDGRDARVVGLLRDGNRRDALTAVVVPTVLSTAAASSNARRLVDVPGTLTWADVRRANAAGYQLTPRGDLPGQPPVQAPSGGTDGKALAVVALVVGMALLEVVLLAGPAFAVGAKRQARDLALLTATGAERRHVRLTVLGSGLVLGVVGGVVGVVGGIGLAAIALPRLSAFDTGVPGPFDVRPLEVLAVAAVGVLTAVLASVLPARAASRQDVVAALTGRRGQLRSLRRTPVLGLVAAVAGGAIALYGARQRDVLVILAGSALAELGLVAMTPFLVGLTGRLGPRLPVGPRLALRDAARNRGRTAPAVSAVLAAVAGSVAVGTYVASLDAYDAARYERSAADGAVVVAFYDARDRPRADQVRDLVERTMPGRSPQVVRAAGVPGDGSADVGYVEVQPDPAQRCPAADLTGPATPEQQAAFSADPRCREPEGGYSRLGGLLVGDGRLVAAVAGVSSPDIDDVLARGGAVVDARSVRPDGTARLVVRPPGEALDGPGRAVDVPATALPAGAVQVMVVSPLAAERLGSGVGVAGVIATGQAAPTAAEEDRLRSGLEALGMSGDVYVERGYVSDYGIGLLALVLGSAVIVLGASGIATGLAAADGRADLSTLAAIGATPGLRRSLAGFQSMVTAGLGTLLGMVAGLVPAIGLIRALNSTAGRPEGFVQADRYPIVLPWTNLAITLLVVPLLAAGAAALLTRSRLPLVRRMA